MKKFFSKIAQRAFALAISIMVVTNTFAQGAAGIDAASSELATYMDPLGNMMMILGGLVGLVGAVRVYLKWNSGDQDVQKAGDEVRCMDGDSVRGQGEVYTVKSTNYFNYSELWM
jgi:hypothetical protein